MTTARTHWRTLVCGGRDYRCRATVFAVLDRLASDSPWPLVIIHGAARGADTLAAQWAKARGCEAVAFPADWERHGKAAGYLRNQQMLEEGKPDMVVAFAGGRGTAHMVRMARAASVIVQEEDDEL